MPIQKVITALGLLAATLAGSATQTQENQAAQERVMAVATQYADAQTVAIGYVDLGEEWIDLWEAMFTEAASGERTTEMDAQTASAREMLRHLRSAGARELVILMSLSDAHAEGGPLVVITREEIPDASVKLAGLIEMGPKQGPWRVAVDIRREMLLVGMPAVVERYKKLQSVPRPDLLGPLEKLLEPSTEGKPTAGLVLSPGSDARRVVRELWPALPKPFDGLTGPLLADDFKYATFHLAQPLSLAVEMRHDEAAARVKATAEEGRKLLVEMLRDNEKMGSPPLEAAKVFDSLAKLVETLPVEQEQTRLSVDIHHGDEFFQDLLHNVLRPAIKASRESARRTQRTNNFKQVGLAMHNFASAKKHLPAAAAIVDKQGKPLLSWRVAILPYLGEQELYNQFRLDEPWDSEHNLKLARQMPSVFADLGHPELIAEGKTTCLLPVHSETVFQPLAELAAPVELKREGKSVFYVRGPRFQDITDGTSSTIMAIQVAPERAVVWTQPADWQVDLETPFEGLLHPKRKVAMAMFCDGSVQSLPFDFDPASMRAFLTRGGKELVSR